MCHKRVEICVACGFDAKVKAIKCRDAPEDIHKRKDFVEDLIEGISHCKSCADVIPGEIPHWARF
ncbi:hypothetical protein FVEN_g12787 [Fusarium venenatum]|uniref:Uncharacterized protein n=1 Tax=Fusarium venenatum TaxID=56646 RepID=A0A2L2TRN8_9HYPO|nr:uncharacterized protein FVRRES_06841 [Fusarium venenatum]KAG8357259.1 hypothetical protein FVEN_g12787 [Fusarium venenatum]CEI62405.1 unnamed protein product [Fusarium venenatum]